VFGVCSHETTSGHESSGVLYVATVLNGCTDHLFVIMCKQLYRSQCRTQSVDTETVGYEECNMALSKLTDLGYGDDGPIPSITTVSSLSGPSSSLRDGVMLGPKAPDIVIGSHCEDGLVTRARSIRTSIPNERLLFIVQTSNCCYRLRFERLRMCAIPLVCWNFSLTVR
jgi:hypothetical protein